MDTAVGAMYFFRDLHCRSGIAVLTSTVIPTELLKFGSRNKQPSNCTVDVSHHPHFTGQERANDARTAFTSGLSQ